MGNRLTLATLDKTINTVGYLLERARQPYFLCFGTLLGLVRDRNVVEGDTDIDLGILAESAHEKPIRACFERFGYRPYKTIRRDDVDKVNPNPLVSREDLAYISFRHLTLPCIDIFIWYKHGDYRWHTYDFHNENKERPTAYHWKGVKSEWLDKIEKSTFGTHLKPLFSRNVYFPLMYGHLLDTWYPDWKTPRKGESTSPWQVEFKSCKSFRDKDLVKKQIAASEEKYNAELNLIV